MLKQYFWNLLIAIDQLLNTILAGDPDETISSRLGKYLSYDKNTWQFKLGNFICSLLRKLDKNHCRRVIEKDEGKNGII